MRAFFLAFTLILSSGPPGGAWADRFEPQPGGWVLYVDDQGTELSVPADVFSPGVSEKTKSGRTFVAEDAKLEVIAKPNPNGWSAKSLKQELLGRQEYRDVTYSPAGAGWLVISGFRDADTIFYEKFLFRGGMLHAFAIEFPAAAKPFYAPIIEHMEDTFRVSHRVTAKEGAPASGSELEPAPSEADPLVVY